MKQQLPTWVVVLVLAVVIVGIVAYAIKSTSVQRGVGKPPAPPPAGMGMPGGMGGGSGAPPGGGAASSPSAPPAEKKDEAKK